MIWKAVWERPFFGSPLQAENTSYIYHLLWRKDCHIGAFNGNQLSCFSESSSHIARQSSSTVAKTAENRKPAFARSWISSSYNQLATTSCVLLLVPTSSYLGYQPVMRSEAWWTRPLATLYPFKQTTVDKCTSLKSNDSKSKQLGSGRCKWANDQEGVAEVDFFWIVARSKGNSNLMFSLSPPSAGERTPISLSQACNSVDLGCGSVPPIKHNR